MEIVSYINLRENLKKYLDTTCQKHILVKIKRSRRTR